MRQAAAQHGPDDRVGFGFCTSSVVKGQIFIGLRTRGKTSKFKEQDIMAFIADFLTVSLLLLKEKRYRTVFGTTFLTNKLLYAGSLSSESAGSGCCTSCSLRIFCL